MSLGVCVALLGACTPKPASPTTSWDDVSTLLTTSLDSILPYHHSIEVGVWRANEARYYHFGQSLPTASSDQDTIFGINSMTKAFTDLALAQLVNEGKVALSDDASMHLPGQTLATYEGQPITIRSLATQSSGLAKMPSNLLSNDNGDAYAGYTDDMEFEYLKTASLAFAPDSAYRYSNTGFGLLGCIVAGIDQKPFADTIADRILSPLGLNDTFAFVDETKLGNLESGHSASGSALPPRSWNECMAGSGILKSTAPDILRFLTFQLQPDQSPFPDVIRSSQAKTDIQESSSGATNIGYPWDVRNNTLTHAKDGGGGGFSSIMFFNVERQTALVLLSSSDPIEPWGILDDPAGTIFASLR